MRCAKSAVASRVDVLKVVKGKVYCGGEWWKVVWVVGWWCCVGGWEVGVCEMWWWREEVVEGWRR